MSIKYLKLIPPFALLLIVFAFVYQVLWAPNIFEGDKVITVSKGETFSEIVDSLENAGVIRNRTLFELAGRILGWTTKMQIGKYRFRSGISNKDILDDLRTGKSIEMVIVVIPEGLRASRIADILWRELRIDTTRFMQLVHEPNLLDKLNIRASSFEGYLMPSTYNFYWQMDEEEIIKTMVQTFWRNFNNDLCERAKKMGRTIHEILTLASIIEAETSIDTERAIIAGVYYNRLNKKMKLEADPTVQYILGEEPRRVRYSDLSKDSPFNTYRYYGLPPGPINNPGMASILAALYPQNHKYFFFVATGQGGHIFSRTYQEHLRAVQQFRKYREQLQTVKEING